MVHHNSSHFWAVPTKPQRLRSRRFTSWRPLEFDPKKASNQVPASFCLDITYIYITSQDGSVFQYMIIIIVIIILINSNNNNNNNNIYIYTHDYYRRKFRSETSDNMDS